jgi:hypothetical protein
MDTKKLVVGQDVNMHSGCYWKKGTVVKVTRSVVEVQEFGSNEIYCFDSLGKGCDGHATYENGPWELE